MIQIIINWLKGLWERHICSDFPDYYNPQCSDCNEDGRTCHKCPFRDKDYRPTLADIEEPSNLNWMGTDDVPPAPEGIHVLSEGKASKLYIEAKDKDINDALKLVDTLMIKYPELKKELHDVQGCLLRALI